MSNTTLHTTPGMDMANVGINWTSQTLRKLKLWARTIYRPSRFRDEDIRHNKDRQEGIDSFSYTYFITGSTTLRGIYRW